MTNQNRPWIIMCLLLAILLASLPGCPPRVVVIDGERVPYDIAETRYFEDAKAAYEEERFQEAVKRFQDFIDTFGRSKNVAEARWLLAQSLDSLNRKEDALAVLINLIREHPRSSLAIEAGLRVGAHHIGRQEYQKAVEALRPAYDHSRGDVRLRIAGMLAEASVGLEEWTDAAGFISEIRSLATTSEAREEADRELLDLIDRKLPQVGLAQLRHSLPSDSPALPLVMMKIGRIHYHQREYSLAKESLNEYLARWPRGAHAGDAGDIIARIEGLSEVRNNVIGVILPLSGRAKPFGEAVLRGLGMALDLGPSSSITLIIRDSGGDSERAVEALEELVFQEKAVGIIGPLLSNTSLAAAAKAQELGVPMISLARAEGLPQTGSWIFRNALTDQSQAQALVHYSVEHLNARTFGILYPNHDYGRALMNHFWDEVDRRKLEVRGVESYSHDETTFQPIIRRLVGRFYLQYRPEYIQEVNRIRSEITDPMRRRRALSRALDLVEPIAEFDVLFVPDSYRTLGLIAPALAVEDVITNVCDTRDIERIKETTGRDELTKVQLLGPNAWNHQELITRGGRHIRCSVFVDGFFADSKRPGTQEFVKRYQEIHGAGRKPDYLEAHGYDTGTIMRHVVEELQPRDRTALRETLLRLPNLPLATGETKFNLEGEVEKTPFLLTVDGEEIVELDLEASEGEPAG